MGKFYRLLLAATAKIGMDHTACNGSGSHDADFDHQIVEVPRFESRQHRHLRSALDWKTPTVSLLQHHVEDRESLPAESRPWNRFNSGVASKGRSRDRS